MTDILVTRDGLIGNSPRYTGHTSPPYQRYLKDDAGNAINLTGVLPSAFTITLVNQSNPLFVKSGAGTFSVPSGTAAQGLVSYQYSSGDVADAGNWYAFWTVQLSDEPAPRVFDPDFLSIILFPSASGGGTISVTIQDVNLSQVSGTAISSGNPVPTSGPVTAIDGGIATIGTTTDTSSANTTIGLLKAIKAYLGATLTTGLTGALPAGTNVIGHVVVDSAGSVTITTLPSIPAGTNVIGHVIVDSAGSVSVTSLPSLPAGSNTIGGVKLIDSAGTNIAGVDSSNNQLVKVNAALPAGTNVIGHVVVDSAGSVSVTSLPALPAGTNVIGHIIVDSGAITANAGTNLNTSLLALETGGNLASIKSDADSIKTYTSAFADSAATTGTVTNDGDVVSIALPGGQATVLANILIGTLVGTLLFEASPDSGTTWLSIQGSQVGSSSLASSTTTAGAWRVGIAGFTNFRIRLHPTTSGVSGTITLRVTQGVYNVFVNNASTLGQAIMANSTPVVIASDQSAVKTKSDFTELASLSAGSLNADLVPSTDVSAYKWLSLHVNTNAYSGTLSFQASNDNVNFSNTVLNQTNAGGGGNTTTTSTNVVYYGPVSFRYFRVRMTSYTSGTAQGTLELYTNATAISGISASQNGTWTVQPGNTQNTTPWLVSNSGSDVTLIASAAFTTTQTTGDQTNVNARGVRVVLDVTNAGTGSVTLEIDAKDVASGKYIAQLTGATVTTTSTNTYVVYPGLTAAANSVASDVLPHTWRVKVTANNANSVTYSVGASMLT